MRITIDDYDPTEEDATQEIANEFYKILEKHGKSKVPIYCIPNEDKN